MSPQFKAVKINCGVTLMPAGPKKQVTFGPGLSMHLTSKGAKDENVKNAVYQFAKWWFEKDTQMMAPLSSFRTHRIYRLAKITGRHGIPILKIRGPLRCGPAYTLSEKT